MTPALIAVSSMRPLFVTATAPVRYRRAAGNDGPNLTLKTMPQACLR